MRHNILILLISLFFLSITIHTSGQKIKRLSATVLNESISFPGTRFSPIHPGFELGILLKEKEKTRSTSQINAYFGFYHHQNISNAFYLNGEYLYRLPFYNKIGFDMFTGLGYMHTFNPTEVYELNTEGEFEKITQFGRPHLIANIGLGLTYMNNSSFEPFVKYKFMIETPFANSIPVIPHSLYLIGFNFKITNNEN